MAERSFTVDEANALLSEVRPLVEQMVEQRGRLGEALQRQEELARKVSGNGGGMRSESPAELQTEIEQAAAGIAQCLEGLNELGVQIKDLDTGLIDFPSVRDGEDVLLCWQLGEDEIGWWHGPEDGFAGRRPL